MSFRSINDVRFVLESILKACNLNTRSATWRHPTTASFSPFIRNWLFFPCNWNLKGTKVIGATASQAGYGCEDEFSINAAILNLRRTKISFLSYFIFFMFNEFFISSLSRGYHIVLLLHVYEKHARGHFQKDLWWLFKFISFDWKVLRLSQILRHRERGLKKCFHGVLRVAIWIIFKCLRMLEESLRTVVHTLCLTLKGLGEFPKEPLKDLWILFSKIFEATDFSFTFSNHFHFPYLFAN